MSKKHPLIPKAEAMALNETPEYTEGVLARKDGHTTSDNPYDFFDTSMEYYAWDIGWQEGFSKRNESS